MCSLDQPSELYATDEPGGRQYKYLRSEPSARNWWADPAGGMRGLAAQVMKCLAEANRL